MRDAEENQQFFQVNCTGGLVVEVLYDSGQVGVNVGKPHSRTSQLDSIKRHLKITKDVIEAFFMLEVPLTQYLRLKICSVIVITASSPACTSSSGILSIPGDFPFFSDFTAVSTLSARLDIYEC